MSRYKNYKIILGFKITALVILFMPANAFAYDGNSITYSIAAKMIDVTEHFSLSLFFAIAEAYKPLYLKIATIGLIIILSKYLFTKVPPIMDMISFIIALVISSAIAFNPGFFKTIVYDLFFETLYNFNQFIVKQAANDMKGMKAISFSSISGMFKTIDLSLMGISDFAYKLTEQNDGFFGDWLLRIQALLISLLYLFIGCYFLIIFSVSILGAHMMIILMPITLSLYPFRKFRHYFSNSINGMFHYGLTTVFACIALCLTLFLCGDLTIEADRLKAEGIKEIPADFLVGSIMIGFLAIFIIKMSTEFASRIMNSATSQLGGAFPMIIAGATTAAKVATKIASSRSGNNKNQNNTSYSTSGGTGQIPTNNIPQKRRNWDKIPTQTKK